MGPAIFVVLKDTECWSGYSNAFSSFLGDAIAAKLGFSISVDFSTTTEAPNASSMVKNYVMWSKVTYAHSYVASEMTEY